MQVNEASHESRVHNREVVLIGAGERRQTLFALFKLLAGYVFILALQLE